MNSAPLSPELVGLGVGLGLFLLIAFAILSSLALFALWIWMLVDCAQAPEKPGSSDRVIWILILVFTGWLGALLYYFIVRRPRVAAARSPFLAEPPPSLPPAA